MRIDAFIVAATLHLADLCRVIVRARIYLGEVPILAIIQNVIVKMFVGRHMVIVAAVISIFIAGACGRRRRRGRGRVDVDACVMTSTPHLAELHWVIIPATVFFGVVPVNTFVQPIVDEIVGHVGVVPAVVPILATGAHRCRISTLVLPFALHNANLEGMVVPATIVPGVFPIFAPIQPLVDEIIGDVRVVAAVPSVDAAGTSRRRRRSVGTVIVDFARLEVAHLVLTAVLSNGVTTLVTIVERIRFEHAGVDCERMDG